MSDIQQCPINIYLSGVLASLNRSPNVNATFKLEAFSFEKILTIFSIMSIAYVIVKYKLVAHAIENSIDAFDRDIVFPNSNEDK